MGRHGRAGGVVKRLLKALRRLLWYRPCIVVDWSGQKTDNPMAHVSVSWHTAKSRGAMTLMSFPSKTHANPAGLARMYGKDIARIFDCDFYDELEQS